jgi:hypothetical protein
MRSLPERDSAKRSVSLFIEDPLEWKGTSNLTRQTIFLVAGMLMRRARPAKS